MKRTYQGKMASQTEDLRLSILQTIDEAGGETNSRIIGSEIPGLGHRVSADRLRTEIAWLDEQGAVTLAEAGSMFIVTLTERGVDLAAGRTAIPGIRRPAPHERR